MAAEILRYCVLSGGRQHRALPFNQSEEIHSPDWGSNPQPSSHAFGAVKKKLLINIAYKIIICIVIKKQLFDKTNKDWVDRA